MSDITCIILAGGAGKRMGTTDKHKVCFPILGRPAIVRALDTYKKAGLRRFIVVVGQMAPQVMATVSNEHPDVTFVYQGEPRGTGHAALIAASSLAAAGYTGNVLITMGDKVIDPKVVQNLKKTFGHAQPALAMVTLPFAGKSGAGRVLIAPDDTVQGIVEKKDFVHAESTGTPIRVGERSFSVAEIEQLKARSNGSLYLFKFPLLWEALNNLTPDNEQGELYLTDAVGMLRAGNHAVSYVDVTDPTKVMAFNTPAELLAIEEALSQDEPVTRVKPRGSSVVQPSQLKPAAEWLTLLCQTDGPMTEQLETIFGSDPAVLREQRAQIVKVVERFIERHGSQRKVVICRAPGRINLMGRHIEHRGGDINVMAISRETVVVAAPRNDDAVTLHNIDGAFPDREFKIGDLLQETSWEDWLEFIDSATVKAVLQDAPGDWSHYARAPLLRLQQEVKTTRLSGMDCVVGTNIPMGAGLSSSSALVVAFAETAIALNGLDVETADFVDLCGEGEWFVGSRGGNGDHAAIRVSKIGAISHLGFFPFELKTHVSLPADLDLVVADSAIEAKKSAGARNAFNHRIAAYRIGQMLLQRNWPAAAGAVHLRDLAPERLGVHPSDLFRAMKLLPEWPTREDLRRTVPVGDQATLESIFATHDDIGPYDLRGVVLYGLAECARSAAFAKLLAAEDLEAIGQMMKISHDGDRVAERRQTSGDRGQETGDTPGSANLPIGCGALRHQGTGEGNQDTGNSFLETMAPNTLQPFQFPTSDADLERFALNEVDLATLPGAYACSTPEIDYLADLVTSVTGVVGAQLSGAGLGGCVMILVKKEATALLNEKLIEGYYTPRQLQPRIYTCQPVQGAGLLTLKS